MPIYLPPWQRPCDCCCPLHHRQPRVTYNDPGCACTITCATQPLTLLADRWDCALFLDAAATSGSSRRSSTALEHGRTPERSTADPSTTTPA